MLFIKNRPDQPPSWKGEMPEPTVKPTVSGDRIPEFEGLRALLAWWVVLHHLYLHSGLVPPLIGKLEFWVGYGWSAVPLFIILSGYVITLLLETRQESYGVFLTRRFFRLAPVFYLLTAYGTVLAALRNEYPGTLRDHVLLHLTMLHGMVPDEVLKDSSISLVHPAWSISVEWQFYLIAPLVPVFCRRSALRTFALIVVCFAATKLLNARYHFPFESNVVLRSGLFAVGIFSYYLARLAVAQAAVLRPYVPFLLPVGFASVWVFRGETFGPGTIWILVLTAVVSRMVGNESLLTRPFAAALRLPPLVWLGRISYSTYLCHNFVLSMIVTALGSRFEALDPRPRSWVLLALGVPLTLTLSLLLFHFVEKPGIRLGHDVVSWSRRKKATRSQPAETLTP